MFNKYILFLFCSFRLLQAGAQNTRNLDFYLQQGSRNSPLLNENYNQAEAVRIDSLKIRSAQQPRINLFANTMYAPVIKGYGYDEAITNSGNYAGGVQASLPFLNGRNIKAEYESASIQHKVANNTLRLNQHDLEKQITDLYLAAQLNFTQINFTGKIVESLRHETEVLKELFQKGIGRQTDYMAVSIELQTQNIQLENFKLLYKSDIILLNSICGIRDTQSIELVPANLQLKTVFNSINSPLFYKFSLDSLSLENQRNLVDVRYRPHLNLFGDAGLNSSHLTGIYQTLGFSFGLTFLMPLYDGHQRNLDYKKIELGQQTRKNYQDYFTNKFSLQRAQISAQIASGERIIVQLQQQQKDAELLVKLIKQQFLNGLATTTDYIVALRNHLNISNELNTALVKKQLLINENNYWTW